MLKLIKLPTTDSTNNEIKRLILSNEIRNKTVIQADVQESGRGQFSRVWDSNIGGLYFSIYRNDISLRDSRDITLKIAGILKKVLNGYFQLEVKIKPPNDIYFNNKKLAGILVETKTSGQELKHVIIGIGLNCNNKLSSQISQQAISLSEILKKEIDINIFLRNLFTIINKELD
jgi:BirA family transcriptional regulator, biotin operon repressor / biotin---[acetyl-CoA-carboxylase] ligase